MFLSCQHIHSKMDYLCLFLLVLVFHCVFSQEDKPSCSSLHCFDMFPPKSNTTEQRSHPVNDVFVFNATLTSDCACDLTQLLFARRLVETGKYIPLNETQISRTSTKIELRDVITSDMAKQSWEYGLFSRSASKTAYSRTSDSYGTRLVYIRPLGPVPVEEKKLTCEVTAKQLVCEPSFTYNPRGIINMTISQTNEPCSAKGEVQRQHTGSTLDWSFSNGTVSLTEHWRVNVSIANQQAMSTCFMVADAAKPPDVTGVSAGINNSQLNVFWHYQLPTFWDLSGEGGDDGLVMQYHVIVSAGHTILTNKSTTDTSMSFPLKLFNIHLEIKVTAQLSRGGQPAPGEGRQPVGKLSKPASTERYIPPEEPHVEAGLFVHQPERHQMILFWQPSLRNADDPDLHYRLERGNDVDGTSRLHETCCTDPANDVFCCSATVQLKPSEWREKLKLSMTSTASGGNSSASSSFLLLPGSSDHDSHDGLATGAEVRFSLTDGVTHIVWSPDHHTDYILVVKRYDQHNHTKIRVLKKVPVSDGACSVNDTSSSIGVAVVLKNGRSRGLVFATLTAPASTPVAADRSVLVIVLLTSIGLIILVCFLVVIGRRKYLRHVKKKQQHADVTIEAPKDIDLALIPQLSSKNEDSQSLSSRDSSRKLDESVTLLDKQKQLEETTDDDGFHSCGSGASSTFGPHLQPSDEQSESFTDSNDVIEFRDPANENALVRLNQHGYGKKDYIDS